MKKLLWIALLTLSFMAVGPGARARYMADEDLYKKAVSIEDGISELKIRITKLKLELTFMNEVLKDRPTRLPASQIPLNKKGKPVVKIDKFKESLRKGGKKALRGKIHDHKDEIREREKTLTRLKKERDDLFRLIKYRVRGSR